MDVVERELKMLTLENGNCPFEEWYKRIRDTTTRARIRARVARVRSGNFGDYKIFSGIGELRLDFGSGYRVYFAQENIAIVVLLAGGDKSTQDTDILRAAELWKEHKDATERFQRDFRE